MNNEELRSTVNRPEVSADIEHAFSRGEYTSYDINPHYDGSPYTSSIIETFFEHGQWWLRETVEDTMDEDEPVHEVTYSVVDCNTHHGFDFELISDVEY